MKRVKLLAITIATAAMLIIAASPAVLAQTKDDICEGVALTGGTCAAGGNSDVNKLITNVINILSIVVGVVAVIMIIVGGLKYITSAGDTTRTSSAKNTILYAVIGLVVVALAQAIVRFVMNRL